MNQFNCIKLKNETKLDFIYRVCSLKDEINLSWKEVQEILNDQLGVNYSDSYYRKGFKNNCFPAFIEEDAAYEDEDKLSELQLTLQELRKERIKNSDERSQIMMAARKIAREETLLEIANSVAATLSTKPVLPNYEYVALPGTNRAILQISDWHYGMEINNPWNIYNPDIAKDRILKLRSNVIKIARANNVKELTIVNLGDLISGRIHETIRIQNRIDVISQALEVAEILTEFIAYLSQYFDIRYISCSDNHSRLEPKKELSLDLESLVRVIDPLLQLRIENLQLKKQCGTVEFLQSPFGLDIAKFNVSSYNIGAVHGHNDNPKVVVQNISLMTQANYDMILTAHLHHFNCDERNNTLIVSNGSLMGVDDYAETLRLSNQASQNLIICDENNVAASIHRIILS